MHKEFLNNFSQGLKEQRKKEGISLEQISQSTKINLKFLNSIENGEFDVMPEVYIRAFLKSYAESIDLDPSMVLADFDLAKKGKFNKTIEEEIPDEEEVIKNSSFESTKEIVEKSSYDDDNSADNQNRKFQLILIGIIIPILLIAYYFLFYKNQERPSVEETPFSQILESQQGETQNVDLNEPVQLPDSSFSLRIEANDKCWIRIIIDENDTSEYSLINKTVKNFDVENNISLLIGNSGGIKLFLNNELLEFGGRKGKVLNCNIDKYGVQISDNKLKE